jgi:hypothetical protein
MGVKVCFENQEFTIIRDTGYHGTPDDFCDGEDHKHYRYNERKAKRQDWYSRDSEEGFDYLVPELKKEPPAPGEVETAAGHDYHEKIMEVAEAKGGETA